MSKFKITTYSPCAALRGLAAVPLQVSAIAVNSVANNVQQSAFSSDGAEVPNMLSPIAATKHLVGAATDLASWAVLTGDIPNPSALERCKAEIAGVAEKIDQQGMQAVRDKYFKKPLPLVLKEPPLTKQTGKNREAVTLHFDSTYKAPAGFPGSQRYMSDRYAPVHQATANILCHTDKPRPWVVYMHGYTMGSQQDTSIVGLKRLHEELGVNVLSVPFPFHGSRKLGMFSGDGALSSDVLDTLNSQAEGIYNVRQALQWVRKNNPGQPIAVFGHSMGGFDTGLLLGLEKVDYGISIIPAFDFYELGRSRLGGWEAEDLKNAKKVLRLLSQDMFPTALPSRHLKVIGAMADNITGPKGAVCMGEKFGVTPRWVPGGHITGGILKTRTLVFEELSEWLREIGRPS